MTNTLINKIDGVATNAKLLALLTLKQKYFFMGPRKRKVLLVDIYFCSLQFSSRALAHHIAENIGIDLHSFNFPFCELFIFCISFLFFHITALFFIDVYFYM